VADRTPSRLEGARQRTAAAKRALAIGSAVAFGVTTLWAYASHPGSAAAPGGTGSVVLDDDAGEDLDFDFGSGSVAPSTGAAPDTGTHVS
jgi:hypothetical protein